MLDNALHVENYAVKCERSFSLYDCYSAYKTKGAQEEG